MRGVDTEHTISCDKGVFFISSLSRNFDDQLCSNFHRFVIFLHMLRYTKWDDWSLAITNSIQWLIKDQERYRIGKKTKSWSSQIYIKLTPSNDDDNRKHPLKYFCLKFHIWWEMCNLNLRFIYRSVIFICLFGINVIQCVIGFSLFARDLDGRSISHFYRIVSFTCGLHEVLTLPATVL